MDFEFPERINFRINESEKANNTNFFRLEHDDIEYVKVDKVETKIKRLKNKIDRLQRELGSVKRSSKNI